MAVCAVWPYLWIVELLPTSRDAVLWITNGDPDFAGLWDWIFRTRHFKVGFRPVTAASYTLNHAIPGDAARSFRCVDLVLHAATVLGVYAVYRRLAPNLRAWGGLVAAGLVALHPLGELVVPHLARRAYPLVTSLILLALLVVPRSGAPARVRIVGGVAAAGIAGLAASAHEVGYLAFLLIVVAGIGDRHDFRRQPALWISAAVVPVGLLLVRSTVVAGGLGGYRSADASPGAIFSATLEALIPVGGLRLGDDPGTLAAPVLAGFLLVSALGIAVGHARRDRLTRVAAVWVIGAILLYLPQGVWFPRQVYVVVPGLGLLLGSLVGHRGLAPRWIGGVTWLAATVATPLVWGVHPEVRLARERQSAVIADVTEAVRSAPDQALVSIVSPRFRAPTAWSLKSRTSPRGVPLGSRAVAFWASRVVPGRGARVVGLMFVPPDAPSPLVRVEADPAGLRLVPTDDLVIEIVEAGPQLQSDGTVLIPWDTRRDRPLRLVVHDGASAWIEDQPRGPR